MGTETEYGISVPGQPAGQPDAGLLPGRQRLRRPRRSRRGARAGTSRRRARCATPAASTCRAQVADPSQLTDEDIGLANVILTNGARLYVDHAHPEYSTPEVHQPARRRPLGQGRRAGHARRRRGWPRRSPARTPIELYKNNTDNKGASYGTHENYLMRRDDAVRRHRPAPDAVLRHAARSSPAPAGSASARTAASTASSSASAPTTSRSRSGSRRRSSGRSSTPATSRTPTRRSTAGCTSSSATPTWPRSRRTSRSAPPRWCWR